MPKIILQRWRPGLPKISLTKLLQERAGLSLTSAKDHVDRFLVGEEVAVSVPTADEAQSLAAAVRQLGVDCEIDGS